MNNIDPWKPARKFAGHVVVGGIGVGVRAGIEANQNLTRFQKDLAKFLVSIGEFAGHAWVENNL